MGNDPINGRDPSGLLRCPSDDKSIDGISCQPVPYICYASRVSAAPGGSGCMGSYYDPSYYDSYADYFIAMATRNHKDWRPLTENEANAALSEHPSLDVDKAWVNYDMPGDSAFTPGNTMHFPESMSFCKDFIACSNGDYAYWFIHEITHVWQYQNGVSPFWGHIFSSDIFTFGDYLTLPNYINTPSSMGLSTEQQADWYGWHYVCSHGLQDGC